MKKLLLYIEEPFVKEHSYLLATSELKFMTQRILLSIGFAVFFGILGLILKQQILFFVAVSMMVCVYLYPLQMLKNYKRKIQNEINEAFPIWILQLEALVLSNNISNAVKKSIDVCPDIIKKEVQELNEKIQKEPINKEHYMNFLKQFRTSDIDEVMLSLYQFNYAKKEDLAFDFSLIHGRIDKLKMTAQENRYRALGDYWGLILMSEPLIGMAYSMYFCMSLDSIIFKFIQ